MTISKPINVSIHKHMIFLTIDPARSRIYWEHTHWLPCSDLLVGSTCFPLYRIPKHDSIVMVHSNKPSQWKRLSISTTSIKFESSSILLKLEYQYELTINNFLTTHNVTRNKLILIFSINYFSKNFFKNTTD